MANYSDSSSLSSLPDTLGSSPPREWFGKTSKSTDDAHLAVNGGSPAHDVKDVISASAVDMTNVDINVNSTPAGPLAQVGSSSTTGSSPHATSSTSPGTASHLDAFSGPIFATNVDAKPVSSSPTSSTKSKKRSHDDVEEQNVRSVTPFQASIPEPTPTPTAKQSKAKKVKLTPSPVPASTRPTRTRKAPERLQDMPAQAIKRKYAPRKTGAGSRIFDPTYITTSSKSRLINTDVYHLLIADSAWTCLTVAEKSELIDMLPGTIENDHIKTAIANGTASQTLRPREFGPNFNLFRTDVAKFLEELRNGQLAPTWIAESLICVQERAAGMHDWWKAEEMEAWWGQKDADF